MRYCLKTTLHSICLIIVISAATVSPALGQDGRLRIDSLSHLAETASEYVEVNLEGPSLKPALELLHLDKQTARVNIASLLSELDAIYVRSFRFDEAGGYAQLDLGSIRTQLREKGWTRIKRRLSHWECNDPELYVYRVTGKTRGLAIICSDPYALTVVSILGTIEFEKLDQLTALIKKLRVKQ